MNGARRFQRGQLSDRWTSLEPALFAMGWPEPSLTRLKEAARRLPAVEGFGLEVHADGARIDLALQIWPGGRARDQAWWSLSERDRRLLPEGVVALLDRWRSTPGLHDPGTSAFVELDLDDEARPPSLFFAFGRPPELAAVVGAAEALGLPPERVEAVRRWAGAPIKHLGARQTAEGLEARVSVADEMILNHSILNIYKNVAITAGLRLDPDGHTTLLGLELKPLDGWTALDAALVAAGVSAADVSPWGAVEVPGARLFRNHVKLTPDGRVAKHYLGVIWG